MTEDMLTERQAALTALGESSCLSPMSALAWLRWTSLRANDRASCCPGSAW